MLWQVTPDLDRSWTVLKDSMYIIAIVLKPAYTARPKHFVA